MIRRVIAVILASAPLIACAGIEASNLKMKSDRVINLCINAIEAHTGQKLSAKVDRIYIDIFKSGYAVSFMDGAIGTFGERSVNPETIWACGISKEKVVALMSPTEGKRSFYSVLFDLNVAR